MFLETFPLVVHPSYTFFISQEKDKWKVPKIKVKNVIKNLFLLFEVTARKRLVTEDTITREHICHIST